MPEAFQEIICLITRKGAREAITKVENTKQSVFAPNVNLQKLLGRSELVLQALFVFP